MTVAPAMEQAARAAASGAAGVGARTRIAALVAVFVISLDISIVNVAVPTLGRELHASLPTLQWILDAYVVAFAALLLASAALARAAGATALLRVGIAAFALASLACAVAPGAATLVVGRAAQGVAASLILPSALAIVIRLARPGAVAAAVGVFSAAGGAATALGPSAGALLLDHLGWRAIFLVNLPIAAAALALLAPAPAHRLDGARERTRLGALAVSAAALVSLTFGLIDAGRSGWHAARPVAAIGAGVAMLLGYGAARALRHGRRRLRHVTQRQLPGSLATLISFAVVMGATFLAPLALVGLYGYSLLRTAGVLSFTSLAILAAAPLAGLLVTRVGLRPVGLAGLAVQAASLLALSRLGLAPSYAAVAAASAGFGAGIGLALPPLTLAVVGRAGPHEVFERTALFSTFRQIGLAVGIAAFGAIAHSRIGVHALASALSPAQAAELQSLAPGAAGTRLGGAAASAVWDGYADTFVAAALATLLAAACLVCVRSRPHPDH